MHTDKNKAHTAFSDVMKVYLDVTNIIDTVVKYLYSNNPQICGFFLFRDVPFMLSKKGFYSNNICKSTVN